MDDPLPGEDVRLDEMSRTEFRDVLRQVKPEMTENGIDAAWEEFSRLKSAARFALSEFLWQ